VGADFDAFSAKLTTRFFLQYARGCSLATVVGPFALIAKHRFFGGFMDEVLIGIIADPSESIAVELSCMSSDDIHVAIMRHAL
jgi:hypothetical protein